MSVTDDPNGRKIVTTSVREILAIVGALLAISLAIISIAGVIGGWAVAHYRLGAVEVQVKSVYDDNVHIKEGAAVLSAEIAVIKSQNSEIKDQNKRILDKINQL